MHNGGASHPLKNDGGAALSSVGSRPMPPFPPMMPTPPFAPHPHQNMPPHPHYGYPGAPPTSVSVEESEDIDHHAAAHEAHATAESLAHKLRKHGEKLIKKGSRRFRASRSYWLSADQERERVMEKHGEESWQARTVGFIQSHPVQMLLVALLILDVCIVAIELFLEAEFPPCVVIRRDAVSCYNASLLLGAAVAASPLETSHARSKSPPPSLARTQRRQDEGAAASEAVTHTAEDATHSTQTEGAHEIAAEGAEEAHEEGHEEEGEHGHHDVCEEHGLMSTGSGASCDEHKWSMVHDAHNVFLWLSVAILVSFLAELLALLACLTFDFVRSPLYLFDLLIVTVSLVLEIVLNQIGEVQLSALSGLLVFARIWRFVRIAHGLATTVHETEAASHEEITRQAEDLQRQVAELRAKLARSAGRRKSLMSR